MVLLYSRFVYTLWFKRDNNHQLTYQQKVRVTCSCRILPIICFLASRKSCHAIICHSVQSYNLYYTTVPLKCKLPPLVSFLARRVSFLARRVSFHSRRVSFLSRRVSFLSRRDSLFARVTEPNILEYITREKPLQSLSRSTCIDHNANADCSLTTGVVVMLQLRRVVLFVYLRHFPQDDVILSLQDTFREFTLFWTMFII